MLWVPENWGRKSRIHGSRTEEEELQGRNKRDFSRLCLSSPSKRIQVQRGGIWFESVPVTHSWLKWEQNQQQSSRNTHSGVKSNLLVGRCGPCWEVKEDILGLVRWDQLINLIICTLSTQSFHVFTWFSELVLPVLFLIVTVIQKAIQRMQACIKRKNTVRLTPS